MIAFQIYLILVIAIFFIMSLWVLVREDYLKDIVYISLTNVLFLLFICLDKVLKTLVRRKIRRDFDINRRDVTMRHYWAYGVPETHYNKNNWYAMLKVIFGKADLEYINDEKWRVSFEVQSDEFR